MTAPDTKAIREKMEAMAGFTAGPWDADLGETYRVKADGMNIATDNFVTLLDRIPTDQVRQNVRLIAAAPDMHEAITALSERCRVLEEALSGLEWACDQLASTRTHEVYLAMIDSGQADALLSLDARRQAARAVLAQEGGAA